MTVEGCMHVLFAVQVCSFYSSWVWCIRSMGLYMFFLDGSGEFRVWGLGFRVYVFFCGSRVCNVHYSLVCCVRSRDAFGVLCTLRFKDAFFLAVHRCGFYGDV